MTVDGFLSEIFSSYQGEGGSVPGSCLGKRQIFVRFAGCNLASGEMGTDGCTYCDSPRAKSRGDSAWIQFSPRGLKRSEVKNPFDVRKALDAVKRLRTRDLHSLSFTGGEPLWQTHFLGSLAEEVRGSGIQTYLETNGSLPCELESVSDLFDFACVDVKDRSANASSNWKALVDRELQSVQILTESGTSTFAKTVVTAETVTDDVEYIASRLADLECALALQVVTPYAGVRPPKRERLFALTSAAAKHLQPEMLSLSVQIHRYLKLY